MFLQKNCPQIDIAIYESAHELSEIGAGIGVWPRIWEILRSLGLEEDLIEVRGTRDKIGESCRHVNLGVFTDSVFESPSHPHLEGRRTRDVPYSRHHPTLCAFISEPPQRSRADQGNARSYFQWKRSTALTSRKSSSSISALPTRSSTSPSASNLTLSPPAPLSPS